MTVARSLAEDAAAAPATPSAPAVEVSGLGVRYGDREALSGVDLSLAAGQRLALLGPNGAGKSTLLAVLATLVRPSAGHARIAGHDVVGEALAARRRLGVVFQGPSLDRRLTVEENLRLLARLYGLRGEALRVAVAEALARVELTERRGERVATLSGGLARRVEIARALLHRPPVLLLDEPSAGLDPAARAELWEHLEALSREGTAVIAATHLGEEAERAHRVAVLDQGRVVAHDTAAALRATIGGEVIVLEVADAKAVAREVTERFPDAHAVAVEGTVRIEKPRAHEFVPRLIESLPGRVHSLTLRQPTLEDVFVHLTGKRFRARGST